MRGHAWAGLFLIACGAPGCFEAVAESADVVADALTRGVRFDGGEIVRGAPPATDADEVTLIPPNLPSVMAPGQVSLMGFDLDNPDDVDNPADATLIQFKGARDHIRVVGGGVSGHFEHQFTVDDDVCDNLCNKRHSVTMRVAMRMRDKRTSAHHDVQMTLDCTESGDPDRCDDRPSSGSDIYRRACANSLELCDGALQEVGVSSDLDECADAYSCVTDFYGQGSQCASVVNALVSCLANVDAASDCQSCAATFIGLTEDCEEPAPCLGSAPVGTVGMVSGAGAGAGGGAGSGAGGSFGSGPVDAGVPDTMGGTTTGPIDQVCRDVCEAEQGAGCMSDLNACLVKCQADLQDPNCQSQRLVLYLCTQAMPEGAFVCGSDGSAARSMMVCAQEQVQLIACRDTRVDAGTPFGGAGGGFPFPPPPDAGVP